MINNQGRKAICTLFDSPSSVPVPTGADTHFYQYIELHDDFNFVIG